MRSGKEVISWCQSAFPEETGRTFETGKFEKAHYEILGEAHHTVWHNRNDGNYIAFFSNDTTNDNVIIVTKDNLTMERLIGTVRYH